MSVKDRWIILVKQPNIGVVFKEKKITPRPKDERPEGGERPTAQPKPQVLSPQPCARGQFHPLHLTPHTHVNGRRGSKTTNRVRRAVRGSRHRIVFGSRHRIVFGSRRRIVRGGRRRIVRGGRHGFALHGRHRVGCGGRRPAVDHRRTCRPHGRTCQ